MPWRARDVRPLLLRRWAGRPQLKRDPLGSSPFANALGSPARIGRSSWAPFSSAARSARRTLLSTGLNQTSGLRHCAECCVGLDSRREFRRRVPLRSTALTLGPRCLLAVALSWDGQHSGAVVVTDSAHEVLFADTTYRDAHQLTITPRGRIVFVYNSQWGSGLWQTKAVALCPVSVDSWIECVELVLEHRVSVIGRDAPGYFGQAGSIAVVGDTIVWQRQDTIQAYAHARPSEYRNLGSVKIPIP